MIIWKVRSPLMTRKLRINTRGMTATASGEVIVSTP